MLEAGDDAGLTSQDSLSGLTRLRLGGPLTAGPALWHTAGSAATVPATEAVATEKAGLLPSVLKGGTALLAFTGGPEGWK